MGLPVILGGLDILMMSPDSVEELLRVAQQHISPRKLRLFLVACCRRVWHQIVDPRSQQAVLLAEQHADGKITEEALDQANEAAADVVGELVGSDNLKVFCAAAAAFHASHWDLEDLDRLSDAPENAILASDSADEDRIQVAILQDLIGDYTQSVVVEESWLTELVKEMASGIYTNSSFEQMPELGALLARAGCTSSALLDHCNEAPQHYRGCWALDLILGKE